MFCEEPLGIPAELLRIYVQVAMLINERVSLVFGALFWVFLCVLMLVFLFVVCGFVGLCVVLFF